MKYEGNAICFGDHVDTDVIIPARYLNTGDPAELALHCMEDIDKTFAGRVRKGDILVAGENFGCGSSREHAPIALKACGISVVIAKSFARIFYRNAINIGLAITECPEAAAAVSEGDRLEADFTLGLIRNLTTGAEYRTEPFPPFIQQIIENGGLIPAIQNGII